MNLLIKELPLQKKAHCKLSRWINPIPCFLILFGPGTNRKGTESAKCESDNDVDDNGDDGDDNGDDECYDEAALETGLT